MRMTTDSRREHGDEPEIARPGLLGAYRGLAMLLGTLVLIQAIMAGRWLGHTQGLNTLIKSHGYLGELAWLVAIVQVVVIAMIGFPRHIRNAVLGVAAAIVVLMALQIGMGYAGRDTNLGKTSGKESRSTHIANGVLIFGLSVLNISYATRVGRPSRGY